MTCTTSLTEVCTRYPCEAAYKGRVHTANDDGQVVHQVRLTGDGGLDGGAWDVSVVAFDWGPWYVAVRVGHEGTGALTVIPPDARLGIGRERESEEQHMADAMENAGRFAQELVQAISWAAKAQITRR